MGKRMMQNAIAYRESLSKIPKIHSESKLSANDVIKEINQEGPFVRRRFRALNMEEQEMVMFTVRFRNELQASYFTTTCFREVSDELCETFARGCDRKFIAFQSLKGKTSKSVFELLFNTATEKLNIEPVGEVEYKFICYDLDFSSHCFEFSEATATTEPSKLSSKYSDRSDLQTTFATIEGKK